MAHGKEHIVVSLTDARTSLPVGASVLSPGGQAAAILLFAVQWVVACFLASLIIWALLNTIRRNYLRANRRALFTAIFLVSVGAASVFMLSRALSLSQPLYSAPVIVLFFLFFFIFPDKRYTNRWTLVLGVFYIFSMIAAFIPQQQDKSNPAASLIAQTPGVAGATTILGEMIALVPLLIGIALQVYYRYRRLPPNDTRPFASQPSVLAFGALALGAALLFLVSGAFAIVFANVQHPVYQLVRTGYFTLAALAPVVLAFLLMRRRLYDRDALLNRLAIFTPLILSLLAIYAAGVVLVALTIPGFQHLSPIEDVPFIILIGLLMAAVFRPLYALVQQAIDRRFYRSRYEAAQTLATLEKNLGEDTHVEPLSVRLTGVLQKAFHLAFVALWLRASPGRSLTGVSPALRPLTHTDSTVQPIELLRQRGTSGDGFGHPLLTLAPDDTGRAALSQPSSVILLDARQTTDSRLLGELYDEGAQIVLPLVSQSEVIGLLALGAQPDARPYTVDDSELLVDAMEQVTPVLRAALAAREQDIETRERERIEQELQTARRIQESLLPKTVPALAGWRIATCYQPAREVGGDFYDFIPLTDGRLGIVLGDVTDKGMPAALVMATTRSMLRAVATQPDASPGSVLAQVNELLCQDLPPSMFVTCFYAILDPASGRLRFANAGQDLPLARHPNGGVDELLARGMPLGLMSGMSYDEQEATLATGDMLLFSSDGLVEAHNREREMFGRTRLVSLLHEHTNGSPIIFLLHELADFTGLGWEQEDDVTLVALSRVDSAESDGTQVTDDRSRADMRSAGEDAVEDQWQTLDEWELPSEQGAERRAIERVVEAVRSLDLPVAKLEQLKTAVGEATMNAMEHGNNYQADLPVKLRVLASPSAVAVRITDEGGELPLPASQTPDLDAKLAGLQSPRGWGMFLIEQFVDEMSVTTDGERRTIELVVKR